jgi:hypothetical protein
MNGFRAIVKTGTMNQRGRNTRLVNLKCSRKLSEASRTIHTVWHMKYRNKTNPNNIKIKKNDVFLHARRRHGYNGNSIPCAIFAKQAEKTTEVIPYAADVSKHMQMKSLLQMYRKTSP